MPRPRRLLARRLRLDSRRQLARGAARPGSAAGRHSRAARGGERLRRPNSRADPRASTPARARDARAAEGGRQRGSPVGRPLGLLFALPPRRPAAHLLPPAARGRQGNGAARRRRARRRETVLPPRERAPFARSPEIRLERRRQGLRDVCDLRARRRRGRRLARPRRERHRRRRVDARFARLSLRRAGRKPSPLAGDAASPRRRAERGRRRFRGGRSRLVHLDRADAARPHCDHFRARPRRVGGARRRSRRSDRAAAADRAAPAGPALRGDGSRRRLLHQDQRRRRARLQESSPRRARRQAKRTGARSSPTRTAVSSRARRCSGIASCCSRARTTFRG